MPVLMIAEVPNLPEEIYGGMIGQLTPLFRASNGFISHSGGPSPAGGWRIVEIWETEEDSENFYNEHVAPDVPPEIVPVRTYYPLHTVIAQ